MKTTLLKPESQKNNFMKTEVKLKKSIEILDYLPKTDNKKEVDEIIEGLKSRPRHLSPKYFYDKKGSELFEEITKLKEYYPTRSEKEIISNLVFNSGISFKNLDIVELGSGDSSKISLLFKQIPKDILQTINYFALDISKSALEKSLNNLQNKFQLKSITGIAADYLNNLHKIPSKRNKLFCFFGGTIGNLTPYKAKAFMKSLGSVMDKNDLLLLGFDLIKDKNIIEAAYNDDKLITNKFNKNILNVVNNKINSNFNPDNFSHLAFYNSDENRIEMHLKAKSQQTVGLNNRLEIKIEKGETIHTENSYKFDLEGIKEFCSYVGLEPKKVFYDNEKRFGVGMFFVR